MRVRKQDSQGLVVIDRDGVQVRVHLKGNQLVVQVSDTWQLSGFQPPQVEGFTRATFSEVPAQKP